MKEWKGQWSADVYDFTNVREYDDVVREASNKGEEIHMARVHGICVEKHSELPKEDKRRKFKGRGVLCREIKSRIRISKQLCSKTSGIPQHHSSHPGGPIYTDVIPDIMSS